MQRESLVLYDNAGRRAYAKIISGHGRFSHCNVGDVITCSTRGLRIRVGKHVASRLVSLTIVCCRKNITRKAADSVFALEMRGVATVKEKAARIPSGGHKNVVFFEAAAQHRKLGQGSKFV